MASYGVPVSLWKRDLAFDHSLSPAGSFANIARKIFSRYRERSVEPETESMATASEPTERETVVVGPALTVENEDDDMSSISSPGLDRNGGPRRFVSLDCGASQETMSMCDFEPEQEYDDRVEECGTASLAPEYWNWSWRGSASTGRDRKGSREAERGRALRCLDCEAYDAHCKSASENFRRVLDSYHKTVSELMLGFKTVLERYPELRVDSSDERLHYMVQAALGRNNLVREMVRLASVKRESMRGDPADETREAERAKRGPVASIHEALKACYTDGEALRMILERYVDVYIRYIEVWREMCSKVSGDITVMEFLNMTSDRPGVSHGEPWSEAKAFAARLRVKLRSLAPGALVDTCVSLLKSVEANLSAVPGQFEKRSNGVIRDAIEKIRERLDAYSSKWSWDSCMNDIYFDLRCDLAVLEDLIGVGEISVKTLLHDRSMLVSQVRKLFRNEGSLELQVVKAQSELRDSMARCRIAEENAFH